MHEQLGGCLNDEMHGLCMVGEMHKQLDGELHGWCEVWIFGSRNALLVGWSDAYMVI